MKKRFRHTDEIAAARKKTRVPGKFRRRLSTTIALAAHEAFAAFK